MAEISSNGLLTCGASQQLITNQQSFLCSTKSAEHNYSKKPQGTGGHWKQNDNVIEKTDVSGKTFVRFRLASAVETPMAMATLCENYRRAIDAEIAVDVNGASPRQSSADPGGRRRASGQSAPATRRAVSAKCTKGTPSTDQSSPA